MTAAITPPAWTEEALCAQVGGDFFYPDHKGGQYFEARKICQACPVVAECLAFVMATEDPSDRHGLWANTTPDDRYRIARERKADDCAA